MANYAPYPVLRFSDNSNNPLVGGKLYVYLSGTTTPTPTYQDVAGTTTNTNPVILDSRGEALVYLNPNISYKFVLKTAADVPVRTTDPITTISQPTNAGNALIGAADAATQRSLLGVDTFRNRNYIINGDFDIWQRGTTFTLGTVNYSYLADCWVGIKIGTGTIAVNQYYAYSSKNDVASGQYICTLTILSSMIEFGQRIENAFTLSGKTVTLSFYARASSASSSFPVKVFVNQYFGSGGSASTTTSTSAFITMVAGSSYQRYSVTLNLPSASSKTISGTNYIYAGISNTSVVDVTTIDTFGWQLEEGSRATSYENVPIQQTLSSCQRYYETSKSNHVGVATASGQSIAGTVYFKVPKYNFGSMSTNLSVISSSNVGNPTVTLVNSDNYTATAASTAAGVASYYFTWTADNGIPTV